MKKIMVSLAGCLMAAVVVICFATNPTAGGSGGSGVVIIRYLK